jgi:hypothetical protein
MMALHELCKVTPVDAKAIKSALEKNADTTTEKDEVNSDDSVVCASLSVLILNLTSGASVVQPLERQSVRACVCGSLF